MMKISYADCWTAAGLGTEVFISGLYNGLDHSRFVEAHEWSHQVPAGGKICQIQRKNFVTDEMRQEAFLSYSDLQQKYFQTLWQRFLQHLQNTLTKNEQAQWASEKFLFLLASTKGAVEDYIWDFQIDPQGSRQAPDPFEGLVRFMQEQVKLSWAQWGQQATVDFQVVSQACASSHLAIEMAHLSLQNMDYDHVFVFAVDSIGPFIYQGFHSLKVLSTTVNRPFATDRDGLQLGESCTLHLFSKKNISQSSSYGCQILAVASETEGGSVTRPSRDGLSLLRALFKVHQQAQVRPDFWIAHGTGTFFNDLAEEKAIRLFQKELNVSAPVTGVKWSVGHCLGASGALDLIAACAVLKNKKLFSLASTKQIDLQFETKFQLNDMTTLNDGLSHHQVALAAMVTSLGFGGVHAALLVQSDLVREDV